MQERIDLDIHERWLDIHEGVLSMKELYEEMVWYARKPHIDHVDEKYNHLPQEMRDIVKQCIRDTERRYPKQVKLLKEDNTNFEHGFNSGCLASLRFVLFAFDNGVDDALHDFPNLDT